MYQCDDSYDSYPKPINLIIEGAYQKQLQCAKWEEADGSYRLDFHQMEEIKDGDASSKVKVKRTTSGELSDCVCNQVHKLIMIFTLMKLLKLKVDWLVGNSWLEFSKGNEIICLVIYSESSIPKSWDVMNSDEQCRKVLLPSTSQEYQDVMNNVLATAGGTVQQIVSVSKAYN